MIEVFGLMCLLALIVMGINTLTGTEWAGQVIMGIVLGIPSGIYIIYKIEHERRNK